MPDKIDSNATGLRYAEEASLGVLGGSPVWKALEPNSYDDFGGNITTVVRNPINPGRQRKKGVVTDLDASGGFNTDLTQTNLQDQLQGFFFADLRRKGEELVTAVDVDLANPDEYEVASTSGFLVNDLIKGSGFSNAANNAVNKVTAVVASTSVEVADGQLVAEGTPPADAQITVVGHQFGAGDLTVDVSGTLPKLVSVAKTMTELGIIPGEWFFIGGDGATNKFFNTENNGFVRALSIGTNEIVIDKAQSTMVTDDGTIDGAGGAGQQIQLYLGRVLKNESDAASQVRRSYNLERTLGNDGVGTQSEYLTGSIPGTLALNVPQADKLTVDLGYVSLDHEQRTGTVGVKTGTRPALVEADMFNTSSDFSRFKMRLYDGASENPSDLFAYVTEATINVDNNLSPNKAVSVLGAFEVTAGQFAVSGSLTVYFSNITAVQAVRNNSDVTFDMCIAKNNAGIAIDIPLVTLGDGRANVEQDQPITLPITLDAATGAGVQAAMDHTLLMVFFDYLPTAAQ